MPDEAQPSVWKRLKRRLWKRKDAGANETFGEAIVDVGASRQQKIRRWLMAMPSLLMGLTLVGILIQSIRTRSDISNRYRGAARAAVNERDIKLARFYYSRLMGEGALGSEQDELNWAMMLTNSGDLPAAIKILDKLAPEDVAGYGPAHRYKALMQMSLLRAGKVSVSDVASKLQWHLKNGAREPTAENHQLWAAYYTLSGQPDKAIAEQTRAAQQNPDLWIEAAALCSTAGQLEDRKRFLARAEAHARNSLDVNPLDQPRRLMLTKVLVDQKRYDEAEAILKSGYQLAESQELRRALSDLEIVRYEQSPPASFKLTDEELTGRVNRLGKALEIDPTNPAVLRHWGLLHERFATPEQKLRLLKMLEQSIVDGQATAFGHFTLGGMLWQSGQHDQAMFHTEQSFKLDPRFMDAANNLSWMLATQTPPDMERAKALIIEALKFAPSNVDYLDTYTEVLVREGKYDDALVILERLLPRAAPNQKQDLHRRLALVYENLGRADLAKMHGDKADPQPVGER